MAAAKEISPASSIHTLPRLLAINKDLSDLDEQIQQAARIIGFPQNWHEIKEENERLTIFKKLVRARAEWVLRWILDKLKDEADLGFQARANVRLWTFLDWIVEVLSTSRIATQLRDSNFLGILERALAENFDKDTAISASHSDNTSDSSATVQGDSKPSRKRKRPSSGVATSSKRIVLHTDSLVQLFGAIVNVARSLERRTNAHGDSEQLLQAEHIKMALRTESAQAARILKYWLIAIHKVLSAASQSSTLTPERILDLSMALEVWELRITDTGDDSVASAEQFSTECLIPTLVLYDYVQTNAALAVDEKNKKQSFEQTAQQLEKLIARHVFAPSRAAYFVEATASAKSSAGVKLREAKVLATNLEPLRARILQAVQIADTQEPIPTFFVPLFHAVPRLLELAIRFSPSRTPRSRIAEQPWIQAVFIALAECAECPLKIPDRVVPQMSSQALEELLDVLQKSDVTVDSDVIMDLFWFHSGVRHPIGVEKEVYWPLVSALIQLDPTAFTARVAPKSLTLDEDRPADTVEYIFDKISALSVSQLGATDINAMDIDGPDHHISSGRVISQYTDGEYKTGREAVLQTIIIPIMHAFARNRTLLAFIGHWDTQLTRTTTLERRPLQELKCSLWQDHSLNLALSDVFEKSLAKTQILGLVREHTDRLKILASSGGLPSNDNDSRGSVSLRSASSSIVLIQAILHSVESDEIYESLPDLLADAFASLSSAVQDDWHRANTDVCLCWMTLSQVLNDLWPLRLHESLELQKETLLPLLSQATKDVVSMRKGKNETPIDSHTRLAAMLFLLNTCDYLRTMPSWESQLQKSLRKSLESISLDRMDTKDIEKIFEIICGEFPQLLEHLQPDRRKGIFLSMLSSLASLAEKNGIGLVQELSKSIFSDSTRAVRDEFAESLIATLDQGGDTPRLLTLTESALLQIRPEALSRERREAILNKMTGLITSGTSSATVLLRVMSSLMQQPNATAQLSSEGKTLYEIAKALDKAKMHSNGTLSLFQDLVSLTLRHILSNKDQAQNKRFLEEFKNKTASASKRVSKGNLASLSYLQGIVAAQGKDVILSWQEYLTILEASLGKTPKAETAILDAFMGIPSDIVQKNPDIRTTARKSLQAWMQSTDGLQQFVDSDDVNLSAALPIETWVKLHTLFAKYELYTDSGWFIQFSAVVLVDAARDVNYAEHRAAILRSLREVFAELSISQKMMIADYFIDVNDELSRDLAGTFLHVLVSTLDDKLDEDEEQRTKQLGLLPRICGLLGKTTTSGSYTALLDTVNVILRDTPSLTTQCSIECTLTAVSQIASRNSPVLPSSLAPAIYSRLCETSRLVLLLHRSRLGGRFHLLLQLLQNLLFDLFIPHGGRNSTLPPWLKSSSTQQVNLTSANAAQYARLLTTLCSPTQSSVQKQHHARATDSKRNLNDPVKAAKDYASHHLYPLLASFCRFSLGGKLDPGVREKLMPGMWEAISVASMDKDSLTAMFSGLDKASRDVWKGLWDEWKGIKEREKEKGI